MPAPVIILGPSHVRVGGEALVEEEGAGLRSIEALLSRGPRAAIVTAKGEEGFFRVSLCLERGVPRVVLGRRLLPEAWVAELGARAKALGSELFEHDDEKGYTRVKPGARLSVGSPDPEIWSTSTNQPPRSTPTNHVVRSTPTNHSADSVETNQNEAARLALGGFVVTDALRSAMREGEPLPMDGEVAGVSAHLEEVAFAIGDKPVLYLVVPEEEAERAASRHPGAFLVKREASLVVRGGAGERVYGDAGERRVHAFVSKDRGLAEQAAGLWEAGSSKNARELGGLLGYPSCCVSAFVALADRGNNAALVYVTASRTRALGAPFATPLNVAVRRLVPFTPCSFGCPRAAHLAERVLAALPDDQGKRLADKLARPVFYLDEARAVVLLGARRTSGGSVEFESARFLPPSAPFGTDADLMARKLFGALLFRGGRISLEGAVEIESPSGTYRLERSVPGLGALLPFGLEERER